MSPSSSKILDAAFASTVTLLVKSTKKMKSKETPAHPRLFQHSLQYRDLESIYEDQEMNGHGPRKYSRCRFILEYVNYENKILSFEIVWKAEPVLIVVRHIKQLPHSS